MPKIQIKEFDRTGVVQRANVSNIVYLPLATKEAVLLLNKRNKSTTLCSSVKELDESLKINKGANPEAPWTGSVIDGNNKKATVGYNIARTLINAGFQVLIEGIVPSGESNDIEISDTSIAALKDKSLFDVRFLTAGMFNTAKNLSSIAEIAAVRQDCIALISLDEDPDKTGEGAFKYTVADIRTAFEGIAAVGAGEAGKYAAGFTPWYETNDVSLIKGVTLDTDEKVYIPAGFGYLFAYANMLANNIAEWKAVAGPQRGIIPGLADVCYDYTSADIEMLQARAKDKEVNLDADTDNVGVAINPICYVRPNGYLIYGNRTLKDNDGVKKTTAQSFLNIRNSVNAIKKTLYNASRAYVFEQNTDVLFINFKNYVTPILERMKTSDGLIGYNFVKVATDAKARLRARLTLIPVDTAEDFEIDVYLVDDLTVTE